MALFEMLKVAIKVFWSKPHWFEFLRWSQLGAASLITLVKCLLHSHACMVLGDFRSTVFEYFVLFLKKKKQTSVLCGCL